MRALVTGGAGFIGSHLCELLLGKGWQVTALDDLSTGAMRNIKGFSLDPDFHFLKVNGHDSLPVLDAVLQHDIVYHLASPVGVDLVQENPRRCLSRMKKLDELVLKAATYGHKKVFYASSSEVYDEIASNDSRAAYQVGKLHGEVLGFACHTEGTMQFVAGRLHNVVGPRQRPDFVVSRFVRQALNGGPITVYGDGSQQRYFMHVTDVVQEIWRLTDGQAGQRRDGESYDWPGCDQCWGEAVSIVNLQGRCSIYALAELVKDMVDKKVEIVTIPSPKIGAMTRDNFGNHFRGSVAPKHIAEMIEDIAKEMRGEN